MASQPAGGALLHLLCDVPGASEPALMAWWDLHVDELLSLPGFVSARRAHRVGPGTSGRILAVYRLTDVQAADQPRPDSFATLPTEVEGSVVFRRRVLRRVDGAGDAEPVGAVVLQLLREPAEPQTIAPALARVRRWPGVLSASAWTNGAATDFHRRSDVVQLGDSDLILVELAAQVPGLDTRAAADLPGWSATAYEHSFPAAGTVRLPESAH